MTTSTPLPLLRGLVLVVTVGALAGVAYGWLVDLVLMTVLEQGAARGTEPLLVVVTVALAVVPVLALTLLVVQLTAFALLRLMTVPRALAVTGLSTVVLAVVLGLLVYGGNPLDVLLRTVVFAAAYGVSHLVLSGRSRH